MYSFDDALLEEQQDFTVLVSSISCLSYSDLSRAHPPEVESAENGKSTPKQEAPAKVAQQQIGCMVLVVDHRKTCSVIPCCTEIHHHH